MSGLSVGVGPRPRRGAPGTKLGPWLFLLVINDLKVDALTWKYVDGRDMSRFARNCEFCEKSQKTEKVEKIKPRQDSRFLRFRRFHNVQTIQFARMVYLKA